jgi:uncharacterized integral membrane protein
MGYRTLALVIAFLLFTIFAAVNWPAFTAPTTLSFVVGSIEAPLGLILLGVIVFVCAAFLLLLAVQQASVLVETRRMAKELSAQRTLADQAEASRFTDLRAYIDQVLQRDRPGGAGIPVDLAARLDRIEAGLKAQAEHSNTLAATIGELDDRIERLLAISRQPPRH